MKNIIRFILNILLGIIILNPQVFNAQINYRFDYLETKDGLLSGQAYAVMEDNEGFIWVGTLGGLQRFDGYEFVNYTHDPFYKKPGLEASVVRDIVQDQSGKIWVAVSGGGVSSIVNGELLPAILADNKSGLSSNLTESLLVDSSNNLWIGTSDAGLNYKVGDSIYNFRHDINNPKSLSSDAVFAILEDKNGQIWIGTKKGINIYKGNGEFERLMHESGNAKSLSHNFVHELFEDKEGTIWVGTVDGGLNRFNAADATFVSFKNNPQDSNSLSNNVVLSIEGAPDGGIWVGTWGGGINHFNGNSFSLINKNTLDQSLRRVDYIEDLMVDSNGNLWGAGYDGGIIKYSETAFSSFQYSDYKEEGMLQSSINSLFKASDDVIWTATNKGINTYSNGEFNQILFENSELKSNDINKIMEDSQGRIWIGMIGIGRGLQVIDNGVFTHFNFDEKDQKSLSNDSVSSIFEDTAGNIWIGTSGGLNRYNEQGGFDRFIANPKNNESLPHNLVSGICEGKGGLLWISTFGGGLAKYQNGKFTTYKNNPENLNSLHNNLWHVVSDSKGNLWVGVRGGIFKFDPDTQAIEFFNQSDGLAGSITEELVIDNKGSLWVGTHSGLSLFNEITNKFESYTEKDGLAGNHINSIFKGKENLYFGGIKGFSFINQDNFEGVKNDAKLVFTKIDVLGEDKSRFNAFDSSNSIRQKSLNLDYDLGSFIIHFTVLNLDIYPSHKYMYRTLGLSDEWLFLGNSNKISYNGISPGDYTLEVKLANSDESSIKLPITIHEPWWKTNLAYLIYLITVLFTSWIVIDFLTNKRKLKYELQLSEKLRLKDHELNKMKVKFFTNVSHELRTPLSLIMGPAQDLLNEDLDDPIKRKVSFINKSTNKLLNLTNQLLDFQKISSNEIEISAGYQDVVFLTKENYKLFSDKAARHAIDYQFRTTHEQVELYFDLAKIETVITNLLSNAFKFQGGKITVNIRIKGEVGKNAIFEDGNLIDNYVQIAVANNGTGIKKTDIPYVFDRFFQANKVDSIYDAGTGIGLDLSKEFIESHKGNLTVESIKDSNTTFFIRLPFGIEHLSENQMLRANIRELSESHKSERLNYSKFVEDFDSKHKSSQFQSTVMVVEDNDDFRNYICESLSSDFNIISVEEGSKALIELNNFYPDIIISDVMMDGMDGIELCQKIKTNNETNHIPVILLTARSLEEHEMEGLIAGANDYIIKPFNMDMLKVKINNFLAIQQSMHDFYESKMTLKDLEIQGKPLSQEEELLNQAIDVIEENLLDANFQIDVIAKELGMSKSGLYQKIKFITGNSVINLISDTRLKKAASLMKSSNKRISEVAYEVGFSDPKYFRIRFKKKFGVTPTDFKKSKH